MENENKIEMQFRLDVPAEFIKNGEARNAYEVQFAFCQRNKFSEDECIRQATKAARNFMPKE